MKLSVVVPTHNRAAGLPRLLTALGRQTLPPEAYEVILVADGCVDETPAVVQALATPYRLVLLEQPALGAAAARNRGAAAATAPILLFLDDDMEAQPALLAAHLHEHAAGANRVVLGYFPLPDAELVDDLIGLTTRQWWAGKFQDQAYWAHRFTFEDFCTGNVSLPRSLFHAAGGFDEVFAGAAGEDYELGLRLLRSGAQFSFARAAAAWHHDRPTEARAFHRAWQNGFGQLHIVRKHPELFYSFALGWPVIGPAIVPLLWLTWRLPAVAAAAAWALRLPLGLARRLRLRRLWQRVYAGLHAYWYWRGVRAAGATLGELARLRQDTPLVAEAACEIELDLACDLPQLPARLAAARADAARLLYHRVPLTRVPPQAGAEALRPEHIGQALLYDAAPGLLALLSLPQLAAQLNLPQPQPARLQAEGPDR